jgi:ATP-binding cassette, subfamily F, member 3
MRRICTTVTLTNWLNRRHPLSRPLTGRFSFHSIIFLHWLLITMSLITVSGLSKSFGHFDLFAGITFSVAKGARLAVVGPNGIGKTTLLRILVGLDEASTGSVARARAVRIGYLPQEADFRMEGTLWEACLDVFADLIRQQEELARLEHQMADPAHRDEVLEKYGQLQHDFEHRGGYTYQTRIRQVLIGLGFDEADHVMSLDHLSGGQRTRAYLARLLLSGPDLLLLDEPTNHLDIRAVEWLEGYLTQPALAAGPGWNGATIIVSHDRYFLDRVATGILEMTAAGSETYRGNYTHYVEQRAERWERRQEVFQSEKDKLFKDLEYIKKNIAGQNTLQAKGKLKRLTRVVQAIEQLGLEAVLSSKWIELGVSMTTSPFSVDEAERRVRALRLPDTRPPHFHLRLQAKRRSGDLVIRTRDLVVGYPGKPLFAAPDLELRRMDCAALIGPNGAGKSTFLKTVLGQLEPLAGGVILGASLHVGYFAQAHEGLNPEHTLIEEIQSTREMLVSEAREYLGKFLFSGDDAFKKVSMLSGGERGRLALAKLAMGETNLLLLDEPTNHLDIPSQEILQEVLDDFPGTILLVTHDRYLVDALATQIWEINDSVGAKAPSGGADASRPPVLLVFKGTYSQMKAEGERLAALTEGAESRILTRAGKRERASKDGKEERRRKAHLQELENAIAMLEARLTELGGALQNPPADPAQVVRLGKEYAQVQDQMDEKLGEWEQMQS